MENLIFIIPSIVLMIYCCVAFCIDELDTSQWEQDCKILFILIIVGVSAAVSIFVYSSDIDQRYERVVKMCERLDK